MKNISIVNYNDEYRRQYEENLRLRQLEHLKNIKSSWRPCLHETCTQCHGTGIKLDGEICVHSISCPCPRCTPQY